MACITEVYWDRGDYEVNQDSAVLEQVVLRHRAITMAAVADGIGGLSEGENVSGYAAGSLIRWFYTEGAYFMLRPGASHLLRRSLERLVYSMHCDIRKYAAVHGKGEMGTTCTLFLMTGKRYYCAHLGDGRCMHIRHGRGLAGVIQRTDAEWITKDDVAENGALTRCIGSMGYFRPKWISGHLASGDRILLCSDGFCRKNDSRKIAAALSSGGITSQTALERSVRTIAQCARSSGEKDNITAICVVV